MKTKPDFRKENKSQSDSVGMQNLVQQNSFTKYKFITKTWKDNPRKGKKDKRRPAGRRCAQRGERGDRGDVRKKEELSTRKVQKLTRPNGTEAFLWDLIVKQSMLKQCSASRPFDF